MKGNKTDSPLQSYSFDENAPNNAQYESIQATNASH